MGVVSIARKLGDAGFERLVVVKRVHRHLLEHAVFRDMLRDEAAIASVIRHANVVPILDVVESDGELALVFEYVESIPLSTLLAAVKVTGQPLPAAIAARILADALAGLHAAHEAVDGAGAPLHIIHRDVSPQNILVGFDGVTRLIDFGIAKAVTRLTETTAGVLKGKPRYMAPEQAKRLPLDRRADVFAAGAVLHEALTGTKLFRGDDEADILLSVLVDEIPAPSSAVVDLPAELDAVVLRAVERDRDERFPTALAFQEALERAIVVAPARDVGGVVERHGGRLLAARREALRAATAAVTEAITVVAPGGGKLGRLALAATGAAALLALATFVYAGRDGALGAAVVPRPTEGDAGSADTGAAVVATTNPSAEPPPATSASAAPPVPTPASRRRTSPRVPAAPPDLHRDPYPRR